tara:strand:- start:331 stop:606 length:276 start_codon:yes stop_codon:yes gene_type:complete
MITKKTNNFSSLTLDAFSFTNQKYVSNLIILTISNRTISLGEWVQEEIYSQSSKVLKKRSGNRTKSLSEWVQEIYSQSSRVLKERIALYIV